MFLIISDSKDGKVTENGWPDDSVYGPGELRFTVFKVKSLLRCD